MYCAIFPSMNHNYSLSAERLKCFAHKGGEKSDCSIIFAWLFPLYDKITYYTKRDQLTTMTVF